MNLVRAEGDSPTEGHRFPCPACGADLRYAPDKVVLRCDHCGHEEPIPEARGAIEALDLRAAERSELPQGAMETTRVARCASCGAEVEFDAAIHAKECPFCASPMVTDTGLHRHIKPQAQLPFLLTEADARAAMQKWLGRRWFAPSDLTKFARAHRGMDGIYVPYWTYDAETRTEYQGQRGTVHHQTRQVTVMIKGKPQSRMQQVPVVRWTRARGRVARDFENVLVLASRSLPKAYTDALAPWDLSVLSAYDPRFLAGFRAEGYGVPVEEAYGEAREIMNRVIAGDVRRDIGGDQQRIDRMETEIGRLSFRHVLLPVWIAAYRYGGRTYRFVVNGRTGSVAGERPYSKVKIALAILLAILAAIVVAYLQISEM